MSRVGIVTSWACRCGIAEYTRSLIDAVPSGRFDFTVLADEASGAPDDAKLPVERCWRRTDDDVSRILAAVRERAIEMVVVEFNWGYLNPRPLGRLLAQLDAMNVPAIVQMHSTGDRVVDGTRQSLADVSTELSTARAIIVHSEADERRMLRLAPGAPIERAILGQAAYPDEVVTEVRTALGLEACAPVLASFGFLFPHKGILELIQAMPAIRLARPKATFLSVCSVIPSMPVSVMYWRRCQLEIQHLHLANAVALITDFLPEAAAMTLLHAADVVVLPYLDTGESASAAARFALSSRRPVVTSSAPIFDPLDGAVHRIPNVSSESIARGASEVLDDASLRERLLAAASLVSAEADWSAVGKRFTEVLNRVAGVRPIGVGSAE